MWFLNWKLNQNFPCMLQVGRWFRNARYAALKSRKVIVFALNLFRLFLCGARYLALEFLGFQIMLVEPVIPIHLAKWLIFYFFYNKDSGSESESFHWELGIALVQHMDHISSAQGIVVVNHLLNQMEQPNSFQKKSNLVAPFIIRVYIGNFDGKTPFH